MRAADRAATVRAMQAWVAEYGRLPTRREWEAAAPGRPSTRTVDRRWGWQELIAEASGRRLDQVLSERREARRRQLLLALRAARAELGRWPTQSEWERGSPSHVTRRNYVRNFGSWEEACRAAVRLRS